jgi:hypothetical protein
VKHHCAQCLTPLFASARQAPSGELLCIGCHHALWGPRRNGDRVASVERYRRGLRLVRRTREQRIAH